MDKYRSREIFLDEGVVRKLESKIQRGEINIAEEIDNAKNTADTQIYKLCISPYTSVETLNMIYDEVLKSKSIISWHILYALAVNPNIDSKKFENFSENRDLRPFRLTMRDWYPVEYRWLFYSRPDLTWETIRQIYNNGCDRHELWILIHNKNMPEDLKKEILSDDWILNSLREQIRWAKPEKLYLNWYAEFFEDLDKKYLDN